VRGRHPSEGGIYPWKRKRPSLGLASLETIWVGFRGMPEKNPGGEGGRPRQTNIRHPMLLELISEIGGHGGGAGGQGT